MIVTLSGVTGTGKSFFKDAIAKELYFKNLAIVTTRKKRINEIDGIDKEFVDDKEFKTLVDNKKIVVDFEFLGFKYGYRKEMLESNENLVTEVHYNTIYEIKKHAKDVFAIYIVPYDIERARKELKKRCLSDRTVQERLKEMEEQIKEYASNKKLQNQFDCVLINDYTDKTKSKLLQIIKEKMSNNNLQLERMC